MIDTTGWVQTTEALQLTGVSPSTLYILRLVKKIETTHVGRTIFYSRADCERIAAERAGNTKQE